METLNTHHGSSSKGRDNLGHGKPSSPEVQTAMSSFLLPWSPPIALKEISPNLSLHENLGVSILLGDNPGSSRKSKREEHGRVGKRERRALISKAPAAATGAQSLPLETHGWSTSPPVPEGVGVYSSLRAWGVRSQAWEQLCHTGPAQTHNQEVFTVEKEDSRHCGDARGGCQGPPGDE